MKKSIMLLLGLCSVCALLTAEQTTVEEMENSLGMKFVRVEAGSFLMGSNDLYRARPVHKVTLTHDYYIGKYEVSRKEWVSIMDDGDPSTNDDPSHFQGNCVHRDFPKGPEREELLSLLPVENISWYDAIDFCNRLSELEGLEPCYHGEGYDITCDFTASGYRLPTEAEWEYAARGGQNMRDTLYSGSNDPDEVAWYTETQGKWNGPKPVGTKAPNEIGIHDMTGNVWEWCWDNMSKDYAYSDNIDPTGSPGYHFTDIGEEEGQMVPSKVVKGSHYFSRSIYNPSLPPVWLPLAERGIGSYPGGRTVGLRVVRNYL